MTSKNRIHISKQRYAWALQRAGYTEDDYIIAHPKSELPLWITEEKEPTIKQLEDFAHSVNVPFGYLFLEEVPSESIPFPMFRGEAGRKEQFDLNVFDTVCSIQQRQSWLEDYISDNEIDTCQLIECITIYTPISEAVEHIRNELHLHEDWAFQLNSPDVAVNKMTEIMEEAGIFIAYNGVVGNNTHRPIEVSECRGFALVNKIAPYIFINSQDAKTAQLFTLVHEMVHLMLGISAGHAEEYFPATDEDEHYCDSVAAEFLVPSNLLKKIWDNNINKMSRKFKVSELVIARRAHDIGLLSDVNYRKFWQEYKNRPARQKKVQSGGSFIRTSIKRVGKLFAIHVNNAINSNQLSYTQAYRLTGLYGQTFDKFMANALIR